MLEDTEEEPKTDRWVVAICVVLASVTFGALVTWIVDRASHW